MVEKVRSWAKERLLVHEDFKGPLRAHKLYKDFGGKDKGLRLKEFGQMLRSVSKEEGWEIRYNLQQGWTGCWLKKSVTDQIVTVQDWARTALDVRAERVRGLFTDEMYAHYLDHMKRCADIPVLGRNLFIRRISALSEFGGTYTTKMHRYRKIGAGFVNCTLRGNPNDSFDLLRTWIRKDLKIGRTVDEETRLDELCMKYKQFLRSQKKVELLPSQSQFPRNLRQLISDVGGTKAWETGNGKAGVVYQRKEKKS